MRAYQIADHFRARGIPVVLGGVHVTILPGEAMQHADAVAVGMAERTWPRLIADFRQGRMAKVYRDEPPEGEWLTGVPAPQRDLLRRSGYMMPNTVHATRGCKRVCDFCAVSLRLAGKYPMYQRQSTFQLIAQLLLNSVMGGDWAGNLKFLIQTCRPGGKLGAKRLLFQGPAQIEDDGTLTHCLNCPDAVVKNGGLVPLCISDKIV